MAFLKHPAHPDRLPLAPRDGGDAGGGGGGGASPVGGPIGGYGGSVGVGPGGVNGNPGADVSSAVGAGYGGSDVGSGGSNPNIANVFGFGIPTSQIAISAVTPSIVGALVGVMSQARAYAESVGIDTDDPSTNDQGGGASDGMSVLGYDPRMLDFYLGLNSDELAGLQWMVDTEDGQRRISDPSAFLKRQRIAQIVDTLNQGGYDEGAWRGPTISNADAEFLRSVGILGTQMGRNEWDLYSRPDVLRDVLGNLLNDGSFLPYDLQARDFGHASGLNKALADQFGYQGDFGEGGFGEWKGQQGADVQSQIDQFIDDWWGPNDDAFNRALAMEFGYQGRFGQGGFQEFAATEGITPEAIQTFRDRYYGTGPYSDPFGDGDGTVTPLPVLVDDTGAGGGGWTEPGLPTPGDFFGDFADALSGILTNFNSALSASLPTIPDYNLGAEVVRGSTKSMDSRSGVDSLRINLGDDFLRAGRSTNTSGRIPYTGLQF